MASTSQAEAQEFIDELRKELGGLTQEQREELPPYALNMINHLRRKLGASTKVLAANLYAKDTRFVYELIQNAEDNSYSIANASSNRPWLKFTLHQDQIVIDCNEDGFSESDVKALCAVGESTKVGATGYIGEKGIGFKSVFKVAQKVHVQSGPFSFAFEYDPHGNDNGLGMVTPMNEPYLQVPDGVRTRMILYLSEDCDRAALGREFETLPDTLLLFLKKLECLSVEISLPSTPTVEISYSISSTGDRISIHKMMPDASSMKNYWVTKRTATNMPTDTAREDVEESEIVLAFPLDEEDIPVIEEQHIFAFLPLRKAGYKFLIQSDFIAQASREDVFDSPWNNYLLNEITEAFVDSVCAFYKHPTLRYHWLRFVPIDPIADEFWGKLQRKLFKRLSSWQAFLAMDECKLLTPSSLREVTDEYRDENQRPLLRDVLDGPSAYVSEEYDKQMDVPIIKALGMTTLSIPDFLDRLKHDLGHNAATSAMYSTPPDSHWHTKVAKLLIKAIDSLQHIDLLPIVPLSNGAWVRPKNATLFFPTLGGIDIPTDLQLNLVAADSLANQSRKQLFTRLGVEECEPSRIFPLIELKARSPGLTIEQSVCHLLFVFWHHAELPADGIKLRLKSEHGRGWFQPGENSIKWAYCSCYENPYSMATLVGDSFPDELGGCIDFPHPAYYQVLEECEQRNDRPGIQWFRDFAELKNTPQLQSRDSPLKMSPELDYIINFCPQYLLGVLEANWDQYQDIDEWDEVIGSAEVPILCYEEPAILNETFLPLPKLKTIVAGLGLERGFGFLKELDGLADNAAISWTFLEQFFVKIEPDVYFWLATLRHAWFEHDEVMADEVFFEIYSHLQRFTLAVEMDEIRSFFDNYGVILAPSPDDTYALEDRLVSRQNCLWDAPEWLSYPNVLCLGRLREYRALYSLCRTTLQIADAGYDDFLDYIKYIQGDTGAAPSEEEETRIPLIYEKLNIKENDGNIKEHIRSQFEEKKLVYYPQTQSWFSPSACIWAEDAIQLPGKVSIATAYQGKKSFFNRVLGVPKPTLDDHIIALKSKTLANPDKGEVMLEMLNICAYSPEPEALKDLRGCKCLPVVYANGMTAWADRSKMFSIVDRREYGELFEGQLTLLDFSLEEVHPLEYFLHGLGLADRYMSRAVQEETQTPDGVIRKGLTNDLRNKAYAISRYAAHLGLKHSLTGAVAMYEILKTMDVYVSDSIFKTVSIEQGDKTVMAQQDSAYLHIEEVEGKLSIYVPKRKKRREVSLSAHVPVALLKHFNVPNFVTGSELGSIITSRNLFTVDELLKHAGIIEVLGIERPEVEDDSDDESCASEDGNLASHPNDEYLPPRNRNNLIIDDDLFLSPRVITPATTSFDGSPSIRERPDLYKQLLEAVTAQAENLKSLPRASESINAPFNFNVSGRLNTALAVGSHIPGEREFNIGAAGELFVFHLLKSLNLPGFGLDNWQSTIRHRVALHDQYQVILPWSGRETADIVYKDNTGLLTSTLIGKGYLHSTIYSSPTYYIEVKTTPGPVDTALYCSQPQVDRMDRMRVQLGSLKRAEIYLIARVFALGDYGIGLKLYVDPATLRRNGELYFKADKYVVTPTR